MVWLERFAPAFASVTHAREGRSSVPRPCFRPFRPWAAGPMPRSATERAAGRPCLPLPLSD